MPQRGERRAYIEAPAKLAYIVIGYKLPSLKTAAQPWEAYALEVLAGVLDAGRSSRLSKNLIRGQEIAASAGAGYSLYSRYDELLLLDAVPAPGHTVRELEIALNKEITKLRKSLVGKEELQRVKAQVLAQETYQLDSVMRQAFMLGMLETIGLGWQAHAEYADRIQAVTAKQVKHVARKYLAKRSKTVAILRPLPIAAKLTSVTRLAAQEQAHAPH